jgi:hypothetical protein
VKHRLHGIQEEKAALAQQTIVRITDDIDKTEATETIRFSVGSENYEIDLNENHARKFRDDIGYFVSYARAVHANGIGRPRPRTARARRRNEDIRAWARKQGHVVGERGRIPVDVIAHYDATHSEG